MFVPERRTWNNKLPIRIGVAALILLFGAVASLGTGTEIAGAVIGTGRIQIESSRQIVQPATDGVVSEIMVKNGDYVKVGQVLLRLDKTLLLSDLNLAEQELYEVLAREAQLRAEADLDDNLTLNNLLEEASKTDKLVRELIDRHKNQLTTKLTTLDQEADLLNKQINQIRRQIDGVESRLEAKRSQRKALERKLRILRDLLSKGLIKSTEYESAEIDLALTTGDIGMLTASAAELAEKITAVELQLLGLPVRVRQTAIDNLTDLQPSKITLIEKRSSTLFKLSRLDVRSPAEGTIHDTKIFGVGAVITSAIPLMYVIPKGSPVVAARIEARDIDQVHLGQRASIRFGSFNYHDTPEIFGSVLKISADAFADPLTGASYYVTEISLPELELLKLGDRELVSGMLVEAFITKDPRTPLSYVVKPFSDYFNRALRDS